MAFDIRNLDQSESGYLSGLQNLQQPGGGGSIGTGGSGLATGLMSGIGQALQGMTLLNDGIDITKAATKFNAGVYRQAGDTSMAGAKFQADVHRQAGQAALHAANYNIALDQLQTSRQQDALGRQLTDIISSNTAKTAANGIMINSKSS